MEDRYHDRDFEQFVKQNADQYRMFPSERVWKEIHGTLHTRKKWYSIGIALLLLTTGVVTWVMLVTPSGKKELASHSPVSQPGTVKKQDTKQLARVVIVPAKKPSANTINNSNSSLAITSQYISQENLFNSPTENETDVLFELQAPERIENPAFPAVTASVEIAKPEALVTKAAPAKLKESRFIPGTTVAAPIITEMADVKVKEENVTAPKAVTDEATAKREVSAEEHISLYPMSIESVVNSYKSPRKRKRMTMQLYFVPTISYRKLTENKAFIEAARANNGIAPGTRITDINEAVTHKPDIGFELGFTTGYPITRNIRLIAGAQFNVSKYDIRAFSYASEIATIALNSGAGANSVSTVTNYRNMGGGNKTNWLRNLYVSASIPVGAEMIVAGVGKKTYAGFGANVQPTVMLANRSYLISTDYKNYAEVPSLTRRWNMNTAFEVFAGSSTGKFKWRVGPQVRYQALSSFDSKYPVKEHLFDFGLKVGIMLK